MRVLFIRFVRKNFTLYKIDGTDFPHFTIIENFIREFFDKINEIVVIDKRNILRSDKKIKQLVVPLTVQYVAINQNEFSSKISFD